MKESLSSSVNASFTAQEPDQLYLKCYYGGLSKTKRGTIMKDDYCLMVSFMFFSCDTINIVHLCFDEVREMMLSRSESTTGITPTTRTTLITLVTTMT